MGSFLMAFTRAGFPQKSIKGLFFHMVDDLN
jgi:hypothetical protein